MDSLGLRLVRLRQFVPNAIKLFQNIFYLLDKAIEIFETEYDQSLGHKVSEFFV